MNLNITGKDFDLTDAIRNYISEKVSKLTKYIGDDFDATATLKIEGNEQVAEIRVSFDGEVIKAVTASKDLYSSIDKDIEILENQEAEIIASKDFISNEVELVGYICKPPIYRQTPFGREIADILLAVNRAYNKSDYIPCIAWGRNARFCSKMAVGTEVKMTGRIQSRMYEKKHEDGTIEPRIAYEVSMANLELIGENKKSDETEQNESNQEKSKVEE